MLAACDHTSGSTPAAWPFTTPDDPRERQVGDVGTGDEEQGGNAAEQRQHSWPLRIAATNDLAR
jgi:hypothetical protein